MNLRTKRLVAAVMVAGGAIALRPGSPARRELRRQLHAVARRARHLRGTLTGVGYRLFRLRPDPDVIDTVLADRVRSTLGGLEKRLDLPRVHVMVDDHVVLLHGDVGSDADVAEIERAVAAVSGVVGVESYLHVGLIRSDTRPSAGHAHQPPSAAYAALLAAATSAGAAPTAAPTLVRGILAALADRIPQGEREHVAGHLPADVRRLFTPPRRTERTARARTVEELVAQITAATGSVPSGNAEAVITGVVRALRDLVPEEAGDVAAVLPDALRRLWHSTTATPTEGERSSP